MRALVVVCSNRASSGEYPDRSGPVLVDGLHALGFEVADPIVVPDGAPVEAALRNAVDVGYDLVVTSGGTGLSPTDHTPEMTRLVLEREIPGLGEGIRAYGVANGIPAAALSRGIAGTAARTLIVNVPGSPGGARDALVVLGPVLVHAVDQMTGGDH